MKRKIRPRMTALAQVIALAAMANGSLPVATAAPQAPGGHAPNGVSAPAETVYLMHVHGLSYSTDGTKTLIPSHVGLAIYSNGHWLKAEGPPHDYMGFSATRDALYSSGHAAPGTKLNNPFGLLKSQDGGRTWKKLGLEGQADFHTMATSYGTNTVYVFNQRPNDRMKQPGIYYTQSDGMQWIAAAAKGLAGDVNGLAIHPTISRVVAVTTDQGLYISEDAADHLRQLQGGQALAAWFDLDGTHLWYSHYAGKPALTRINWRDGKDPQEVTLPPLTDDAVAFIAQNPAKHGEIAIATFKRNVYLSEDRGRTWKQIAKEGQTQ